MDTGAGDDVVEPVADVELLAGCLYGAWYIAKARARAGTRDLVSE